MYKMSGIKMDVCLNHNDKNVISYFQSIGPEDTYRLYVENGYFLPDWNKYNKKQAQHFSASQVKSFLGTMLPTGSFKFDNIKSIASILPVEAQAAFWKNTFYFKDKVSMGEASEEAFHAIVSTILSAEDQRKLYDAGESIIGTKELNRLVDEFTRDYPKTYNGLSESQKRDRVIEEFLAQQYVNFHQYGESAITNDAQKARLQKMFGNTIGEFLYELFDSIRALFSSSAANRNYVEALFANIKNGKFKQATVIPSDNVTPSTHILKSQTQGGKMLALSQADSTQIINNIAGLYYQVAQKSKLSPEETFEKTMRVAAKYYETVNPGIVGAFTPKITEFDFTTMALVESDNQDYLDLAKAVSERIDDTDFINFDALEEDGGDNLSDENSSEYDFSDSRSANETGFDNMGGWLKQYLKSVGIQKEIVDFEGEQYPFLEIVDERKLYYGAARALNNSKNDYERLVKLINFSSYENNEAAKALVYKVIRDTTTAQSDEEIQVKIKSIANDYINAEEGADISKLINKHFNTQRTYVLQNILKGFDLWSRTNIMQIVTPSKGISKSFNANTNNSIATQTAQWQQNFLTKSPEALIGLKGIIEEVNSVTNKTAQKYEAALKSAAITNQNILRDSLGVTVSQDALKWLLINDDSILTPETKAAYQAIKDQIYTIASRKDLDKMMTAIKGNNKPENFENTYEPNKGIKGRLELLAQINSLFDEAVFESSYKNAEGKTIYGFQWKTFHLEFVSALQNKDFRKSLYNNGLTAYRYKYEDGQRIPVYLQEPNDFLRENIFLKQLIDTDGNPKDSMIARMLPYFKLESMDGIRQEEFGSVENGTTFSKVTTKDFDLFRMNLVMSRAVTITDINSKGNEVQVTLYPHYLGNLEAKRTADFVYLPELEGLTLGRDLTRRGIKALKEEIRKEYDRIQRVHNEISNMITENPDDFEFNDEGVTTLTSGVMRRILGKDIIEKYHTGRVQRVNLEQGGYIYRSVGNPKGPRALEFSDSVAGILPKEFMRGGLADAALRGESLEDFWNARDLDSLINKHWNETIFDVHLKQLERENIDLLDARWKTDGKLNEQKYFNFIASSYLNVLAFNQLAHGDPALLYKNDGADMAKRFGGRNAAKQSAETFLIAPQLGITEARTEIRAVVGSEFESRVSYNPNETIDQADAQNYATVEYKRYFLWSRGKLNDFMAAILDKVEQGIPLDKTEQERMIQGNKAGTAQFLNVDKTVAFNGVQYWKKSDMMLTKELTSLLIPEVERRIQGLEAQPQTAEIKAEIKKLRMDENNWIARPDFEYHHKLRQSMEGWRSETEEEGSILTKYEDKKYDLYMPISASKMFNVNVFDHTQHLNNVDDSIIFMKAKDYGLQLENPPGKVRIIDPSQMIEIIYNEQDDNVEVYYKNSDKPTTMAKLGDLYNKYLTSRDNSMYTLARNEIFDEFGEFDGATFFEKTIQTLASSGADPQTISVYQLDEFGQPQYNPNMGITKDKFASLYFAHLTKGVLQQKVAGDALAHVSSYGVKPLKVITRRPVQGTTDQYVYSWEVVKRDSDEYKRVAFSKNYEPLNLEAKYNKKTGGIIYDPTLPTDILRDTLAEMFESGRFYFTDELRHLKPRYIENPQTGEVKAKPHSYYSETMIPTYSTDIPEITEEVRWMFGTRIPSQDKHSAVNIEWVDALPLYYGNTIITAKEIVTISGSDFDIDKLFTIKPELYKHMGIMRKYGTGEKYLEYIAFLKDQSSAFNEGYYALVDAKGDSGIKEVNQRIKEIKDELITADTQLQTATPFEASQINSLLTLLYRDLYDAKQLKEGLVDNWAFKNAIFKLDVANLLNSLRLPASDEEIEVFENPYAINNELLELRQIGLTNDGTILPRDGFEATYKTAATMTVFKDAMKDPMFTREDGTNVFDSSNPLPLHMFNTHSDVHAKVVTGKQNINPNVNGNLALILASKAGLEINPDFRLTINGYTIGSFGRISPDNRRIFDTLSSLISAATDEAKEQLNARYNLSLDAAKVVKTMVSLGIPLTTTIAFVNQPVIQQFLQMKRDNFQSIYLRENRTFNSEDDIIATLVGSLKRGYKGDYGNAELGANITGRDNGVATQRSFDKRLLNDLLKFQQIDEQMNKLTRFIKLKKGFTGGLVQLDLLTDAIDELGFYLPKKGVKKFMAMNPINTHTILNDEVASRIPQTVNFIENIIPDQVKLVKKVFMERVDGYAELKGAIRTQLKNLNEQKLNEFARDMDSFMFMDLYKEKIKDDPQMLSLLNKSVFEVQKGKTTVADDFLKLKSRIEDASSKSFDETDRDDDIFLNLRGLSLLNRLKVSSSRKYKNLVMNTFSKVSSEEQEDLINSFRILTEELAYLTQSENADLKILPKRLFAYFVMKDAFQVKAGSISKLFPIEMFKDHSNSIDMALNGTATIFNKIKGEEGFYEVMKQFMSTYASSSANVFNLKNIKSRVNKNPWIDLMVNDKFTLAPLASMSEEKIEEAMVNFPFKYEIVKDKVVLTNIPIFVRQSVRVKDEIGMDVTEQRVKRLDYVIHDGTKIEYSDPNFFKIVLNDPAKITDLKYVMHPMYENYNQSIYTYDMTGYEGLSESGLDVLAEMTANDIMDDYVQRQVDEAEKRENEVPGCTNPFE